MIGMVHVVPEQNESWTELSAKPPAPTGMSLVALSEARWTW
jgi:hypothetical protein